MRNKAPYVLVPELRRKQVKKSSSKGKGKGKGKGATVDEDQGEEGEGEADADGEPDAEGEQDELAHEEYPGESFNSRTTAQIANCYAENDTTLWEYLGPDTSNPNDTHDAEGRPHSEDRQSPPPPIAALPESHQSPAPRNPTSPPPENRAPPPSEEPAWQDEVRRLAEAEKRRLEANEGDGEGSRSRRDVGTETERELTPSRELVGSAPRFTFSVPSPSSNAYREMRKAIGNEVGSFVGEQITPELVEKMGALLIKTVAFQGFAEGLQQKMKTMNDETTEKMKTMNDETARRMEDRLQTSLEQMESSQTAAFARFQEAQTASLAKLEESQTGSLTRLTSLMEKTAERTELLVERTSPGQPPRRRLFDDDLFVGPDEYPAPRRGHQHPLGPLPPHVQYPEPPIPTGSATDPHYRFHTTPERRDRSPYDRLGSNSPSFTLSEGRRHLDYDEGEQPLVFSAAEVDQLNVLFQIVDDELERYELEDSSDDRSYNPRDLLTPRSTAPLTRPVTPPQVEKDPEVEEGELSEDGGE